MPLGFARTLLCNLVRVKLSCYELEQCSLSVEDYLKAFMENEVKPLWPKGWMQTRCVSDCVLALPSAGKISCNLKFILSFSGCFLRRVVRYTVISLACEYINLFIYIYTICIPNRTCIWIKVATAYSIIQRASSWCIKKHVYYLAKD